MEYGIILTAKVEITMKKTVESSATCSQKALKISAKARYALRLVLDVAAHAGDEKPRTGAK